MPVLQWLQLPESQRTTPERPGVPSPTWILTFLALTFKPMPRAQHLWRNHHVAHACSHILEGRNRLIPGVHLPSSPAEMLGIWFNERTYLKIEDGGTREMAQWDWQPEFDPCNLHGVRRKPTLSDPHMHAVVCACTCAHTNK